MPFKSLAKIPMDLGFEVMHKPEPENYAHALILGDTTDIARKLAKKCNPLEKGIHV